MFVFLYCRLIEQTTVINLHPDENFRFIGEREHDMLTEIM